MVPVRVVLPMHAASRPPAVRWGRGPGGVCRRTYRPRSTLGFCMHSSWKTLSTNRLGAVNPLYAITPSGIPDRPCRRWFSAGIGGGQVATEAPSGVFGEIPDGRPSARCGMGPDMVVGNHEAPGIPPVLIESGCDGGGFVELPALGALAPPDAAILFGTAGLDALHGNVALLEKFLEDATELGAVVGLDPGFRPGRSRGCAWRPPYVARRRGGDVPRRSVSRPGRRPSADRSSGRGDRAETGCWPAPSLRVGGGGCPSAGGLRGDAEWIAYGAAGGPEAVNSCFSWDISGPARPSLQRFGSPRPTERSQSCRAPRCAAWGLNECRGSQFELVGPCRATQPPGPSGVRSRV